VLLSGGPGFSPEYLRPVAEALSDRYSAVLFHQRGTGLSSMETINADTHAFSKLVADLDALRRELKVKELTIVGHSWGGILSMLYAAQHPDRVRALALVDSGGPTTQGVTKFVTNLNARLTPEEAAAVKEWSAPARRKENPKKAVLEITKARTGSYFADRAKAKALIDGLTEDSFNDAVFWAVTPQLTPAFDLRETLKKLEARVLVIHGKQDPLETAQEVHETFPASRLVVIENAGHFPWLEQGERFYAVLGEFLR
jgi:proline iminopeptidase